MQGSGVIAWNDMPWSHWVCCSRTGTSLTFMTRDDWRHAKEFIDILTEALQVSPASLLLFTYYYIMYAMYPHCIA